MKGPATSAQLTVWERKAGAAAIAHTFCLPEVLEPRPPTAIHSSTWPLTIKRAGPRRRQKNRGRCLCPDPKAIFLGGRFRTTMVRKRKSRTLAGPATVCRLGADNHLPEGNNCRLCACHLGDTARTADSRVAVCRAAGDAQCEDPHASHAPSAAPGRRQADLRTGSRGQKCQRCALDTRKSRKTCTRATDFSSSG
jgi:hypothetical protein